MRELSIFADEMTMNVRISDNLNLELLVDGRNVRVVLLEWIDELMLEAPKLFGCIKGFMPHPWY